MEEPNSLIEQRKTNLAKLREKGIDPFKNKFTPDIGCGEARAKYVAGEFKEGQHVEIAGRITAHRDMGKSQFMDLRDSGGRIQIYAQKQTLGDEQFDIFKHLDLADFIGVKGELFTTKAGEPSLKITEFTILAKALRPPPAKWHGLEDTEIRYRQRYLDLMANEEVRRTFLQRSAIVHEIRQFFHGRGYVEVETPAMQAIPGGAAAAPFKTFHNALGCDFYLRIALELYHKRLLVGGIDKLFEIGKNFRNEGLSRRHNPEFTMLEAYCAFGDYESMMKLVEALLKHIAESVFPERNYKFPRNRKTEVKQAIVSAMEKIRDAGSAVHRWGMSKEDQKKAAEEFNNLVVQPFNELHVSLSILEQQYHWDAARHAVSVIETAKNSFVENRSKPSGLLDWSEENSSKAFNLLDSARSNLEPLTTEEFIDLSKWESKRYKDLVRSIVRAKTNDRVNDWFVLTPEDRRRVAIEDLKLAGEIADGYEDFEVTGAVFEKLIEPTLIQPTFVTHLPKELVPLAKLSPDDPTTVEVFECCINGQEIAPGYTEQNDPIVQRERLEHQAGGEQQKLDEDFLVALEHGMPPAGGIGIGIDRLSMMLLSQESIRDVILFPQLKQKQRAS